jgi:peptide deformylase
MQLVKPDDPILRKVCRADFTVTMRDIMQMFGILQATKGLGLAASQVGIDARLFVTVWGEVFVNPRVVGIDGPVRSTEGCLSLPGVTAQMDRWDTIRLADGRVYAGERAVVVLHEIDHMDGVLITDFPQGRPHA